ncbi:MAG: hypothetical protein Q7S84_04545 [bacterium]|nr:hypothetical protein [bacterium]
MKKPLYVDHEEFEYFCKNKAVTALQAAGAIAAFTTAGDSVQLVDRSSHACQDAKIEWIRPSGTFGFYSVSFSIE